MKSPWLHRCAILVAFLTLIVMVLGACLTSEIRTFPGAATPSAVSMPSLEQAHRIAGYVVAILMFGLAIWASGIRGGTIVTTLIVQVISGRAPVLHALLAPVVFSLMVVIAVLTSESWQQGPKPVESPWGALRTLGLAVPVLVLIQIGIGAAFRHNAMNVLWHILNALIVLTVVLVAGVFVCRQYPEHSGLRPAALALLIIAGIQVLLGFSVYLVLLMSSENNTALIVTGVIHVANGALTLAASVVLAMQMQRNLIQSSGA